MSGLFIVSALVPLVGASTQTTFNGDVVVNGDFADARPVGHPLKFYCDPYNPGAPDPTGACAGANGFVAFDWTAPTENLADISLVEGGIRIHGGPGSSFVQQHFNGSSGPDRPMQFYGILLRGHGEGASATGRIDIRYGVDGAAQSKTLSFTLPAGGATIEKRATDFGLTQGQLINARSVRVWIDSGKTAVLERVSVYATNGIDGRNIHITTTGDDAITPLGAAGILSPGADGTYSFLVGMAADDGDFLPSKNAWICFYTGEQAMEDRGFPANLDTCRDAYLRSPNAAIVRTKVGDAWRFDVQPSAIVPPATSIGGVAVYGIVEVDGSYNSFTPGAAQEWKSGYLHLARIAADAADAGVSQEQFGPTPFFLDGNADGIPDITQTGEADGHSVIITPRLATETPLATIVAPGVDGTYAFDVQVYRYDGATGAPMALPGGIAFGIFDGEGLVNGGSFDSRAFWTASGADMSRVDGQTWRVRVPASAMPAQTPVGIWAFYDVGEPRRVDAMAPIYGPSKSSTDYYSATRNAVKAFAVADSMRVLATPILFDAASTTQASTVVIRLAPDADAVTPLDGTILLGDDGDGNVTFEYAMLLGDGRPRVPVGGSHALAIYDAAGIASDDLQPGSRALRHAEWVGEGVATPDGWFRVQVPLSAFEHAKGPVAAWAYVDDARPSGLVSRSTYFNVLKPAVAAMSTTAAESALYGPTPLVVLDEALGIPKILAAALASAGSGVLAPGNPLVNPGFDADLLVDGHNDARDGTGGTMTAPPWFLRLDDKGTGEATVPASTHEVIRGTGTKLDSMLRVNFHTADKGKSLMLGQVLGTPEGGDALVWRGVSKASFDAKPDGRRDVTMGVLVRYLDADGALGHATGSVLIPAAAGWTRYHVPLTAPADARLLGFYLLPDAAQRTSFVLDNVALSGVETTMGDSRTDITDGYSVHVLPQDLAGAEQSRVQGASGQFYLYTVSVADHTTGGGELVDLAGKPRAFALRTQQLQTHAGFTLDVKGRTDQFVAVVPVGDVPAPLAAPWAFVSVGSPYTTLRAGIDNHPASGYYNPMKTQLAATPLADQLDYGATPVRFGTSVARTLAAPQQLHLDPVSGGWSVRIEADTPFVETTTLTVSRPSAAPAQYPVAFGTTIPGLVLTNADLDVVTLQTASTTFTQGARLIPGSPVASFDVCRAAIPGCTDADILSGETLAFQSTSVSPSGETLAHAWRFGDSAQANGASVTHAYATSGSFVANLTVTTPTGKTAWAERTIVVGNRAPTIAGLDATPTTVHAESIVSVRARASDPEGHALAYTWTLDGVLVPGATTSLLRLTPAVLDATLGRTTLEVKSYDVGVSVNDGHGGIVGAVTTFIVVDRPPQVGAPTLDIVEAPGKPHALVGETLAISVVASDPEDVVTGVDAEVTIGGGPSATVALSSLDGRLWTGTFTTSQAGMHAVRATATAAGATATGATVLKDVRIDAPPILALGVPSLVQAGESRTVSASAIDPDGRGPVLVALRLNGILVGESTNGTLSVSHAFDDVGVVMVLATAVDATGASADLSGIIEVDDVIHVALEIVTRPATPADGHVLRVRVTGVDGQGIEGSEVLIEDFLAPLPGAMSTQTVTTGADGTAEFTIAPEGVIVGLPLDHRVRATATADSAPDAPVQDEETAIAEISFRNEGSILAGIVLP